MTRITSLQGLLLNLKGEIQPGRREYLSKKEAYKQLIFHTGQEFGEDIKGWEQWIHDHPTSIKASKDVSSRAAKYLPNSWQRFLKGETNDPENGDSRVGDLPQMR